MAKYRHLTEEELQLFEKEFIDFLVVNGIDADSWEQLKQDEQDKAFNIVELFSDVVFEQILRNVEFLEKHDPAVMQFIHCGSDKMVLIAIKRKKDSIDLTETSLSELELSDIELIKGEKPYKEIREMDLFQMFVEGYQPSDGAGWKQIKQVIQD